MLWIASFVCFLSAAYHFYINRGRLVTVGGVVSLLWGIVNMINAISPFDWYPLNDQCKIVILVGSFAIVVGLFTTRQMPCVQLNNNKNNENLDFNEIYKIFFYLQAILIVVMIPVVLKSLRILMSNNFSMTLLRNIYVSGGEGGSYMSTLERLFYIHYIVGPSSMACIIIDSILFFRHELWKKPLIFIVLLSLLPTIYSAARTHIFFAAISIAIAYFQYKGRTTNNNDIKRVKRKLGIVFLVLVAFMVVITMLRGNKSNGVIGYVFKTLVSYFCGGTRVLNRALESPALFGLDDYSYGYCTIAGLFSIINLINTYIFGRVGLNLLPIEFASKMNVQTYLANNVQIGLVSSLNAFSTMFYYFLRDGVIVFLIIVVIISGRLLTRYEKRSATNGSLKNSFTYILFFYTAIMSVCWWEPARTEFWMILIWGRLLCRWLEKRKVVKTRR